MEKEADLQELAPFFAQNNLKEKLLTASFPKMWIALKA